MDIFNSRKQAAEWRSNPTSTINTPNGSIVSVLERKRLAVESPAFANSVLFSFDSAIRSAGSIAQPSFSLKRPLNRAYAISLRHAQIPVSWGNLLSNVGLEIKTQNVSPYPSDIILPPGQWSYDLGGGIITFTQASTAPYTSYTDNIIYEILRQFAGALVSIAVNASTGVWTWTWDPALGLVTPVSSTGSSFFKIVNVQIGTWLSSGPPDLTGPKRIMVSMSQLPGNSFSLPNITSQTFLCSVPVTDTFGDVIYHEPKVEYVVQFQNPVTLSNLTFALIEPNTNTVLPATIDWSCELKFYVMDTVEQ